MHRQDLLAILSIVAVLGGFIYFLYRAIRKAIRENKKQTLRITILYLMNDNKKETYSEIFMLYDEYKELGGNGYVDVAFSARKTKNLLS